MGRIRSERDLIDACRRGDRAAQRSLYERTSRAVFGTLLRITGNRDDASDLAQEVYVKCFRQLSRFDGRSSIETWLYRVAVNEALQFLRRRTRRAERFEQAVRERAALRTDDNFRDRPREMIRAAIASLDPEDRALLLLRYQEGLEYRALAHIFDCAPGTVASRLNRARARLAEIVRENRTDAEGMPPRSHPTSGTVSDTRTDGDR